MPATPRSWSLLALPGLLCSAAVMAQDKPQEKPQDKPAAPAPGNPTQPAPAGTEGAGQPVSIAFKYKAGQMQEFRATTKGDLNLSPEGGAGGGIGALPVGVNTVVTYNERVAGTHQGTGTIVMRVTGVSVTSNVMGRNFNVRVKNGKSTVTMDGKPAPPGAPGAGAFKAMTATGPFKFKRDPLGQMSGDAKDLAAIGGLTEGAATGIASLPEKPVQVGESWEKSQKVRPNIGGANPNAAVATPEIEVKMTYTLKSIETKNGKKLAIIESSGSGSTPADAQGLSLNENITGTTRFDIDRGAVAGGRYNADISMKIPMPQIPGLGQGAGAGAPAAGAMLRIDGTMQTTLLEIPATTSAAHKPAAKK